MSHLASPPSVAEGGPPHGAPARPPGILQRWAEGSMVVGLAGMVLAVFVNVVLRYGFDTGIVFYEELARLLFVWLVAVGTIVAAVEGKHLGFDMLTARAGPRLRKTLFWVSQLLVGMCMLMLLKGSWDQVVAGMHSFSTVIGYPLALGAAATLALAVGLLVVLAIDLVRGRDRVQVPDLGVE